MRGDCCLEGFPMTIASPPVPESPYFNRELSWLAFNERVLREASDPRVPLLERVKFLAIFSSNLDEFFMVRVAGLRRQAAAKVTTAPPDGLSPEDQLAAIRRRVDALLLVQRALLTTLLEELAPRGVRLLRMDELTSTECSTLDDVFEGQIFPVLTPLAVDPGHPFPYLSNLSISLAVDIRDPEKGTEHFARVKVPKSLPRWIPITGRVNAFVPLEQVIGENLDALFPGMEVLGWYAFRVTRYSDLELPNAEEPEDLLAEIEQQVFKRRFGEVIRVEVQDDMPPHLRALLLSELQDDEESAMMLMEADLEEAGTLLDMSDLLSMASLDIPDLKEAPYTPKTPPELQNPDRSIFEVIRERDLLVHHPFDSFPATVERFIEEAATDDNVLAIKLTLYRTSGDTELVRALTEAARRGKQVAVLVELKARFDEANNITWARQLESFGVHVAYGSANMKTHTKVAMVVRRETDGIRRYIHVGTGNYNSKTARQYTDIGLFTCSPSIGADVSDLFNSLTGYARQRYYRKLLVAPANMKDRFFELIERESAHARAGRQARIVAKMNSLVDAEIIDALYRASQAGVTIDLIIRGICCLRPGVQGMSEHIRVVSVIGRFLEHSRLFYFRNDGAEEYFIGSADWMPRNFIRRVEAVVPVEDPTLHARLQALIDTLLNDNRQAWDLHASGDWVQRRPATTVQGTHEILVSDSWGRPGPIRSSDGAYTDPRTYAERGGFS
ncbi:MAG: polyphosphate kinase [Gemmatimonadetes bacterium]|nr:polyphosphate kinase [Gemmatimonadota bacterium]